ncbi:hypothetical protein [Marinomonas sp.]|uniref:hypothetical protein n=1 Tax=Marinomonas sp. TaxID=1904862 RepID=UPI003A914D27
MKKTFFAIQAALMLTAGSVHAEMPVFDANEKYTGTAIAFTESVLEIDFKRQMVNVLENDGNTQTYVYTLIPCKNSDFVRMAIKDQNATGLPVFSYISSCFYDTVSERFAK